MPKKTKKKKPHAMLLRLSDQERSRLEDLATRDGVRAPMAEVIRWLINRQWESTRNGAV